MNAKLSFAPFIKTGSTETIYMLWGIVVRSVNSFTLHGRAIAFAHIIGSRVVFPENLPITCPLEFHPVVHAIVLISNLRAAQMFII